MADARKLTGTEACEIITALRLQAAAYTRSAETYQRDGLASTGQTWAKWANRCLDLATLFEDSLSVTVDLTAPDEPDNTGLGEAVARYNKGLTRVTPEI